MTDGLILLGFLAVIFAILVLRGRRWLRNGRHLKFFHDRGRRIRDRRAILWATQRH